MKRSRNISKKQREQRAKEKQNQEKRVASLKLFIGKPSRRKVKAKKLEIPLVDYNEGRKVVATSDIMTGSTKRKASVLDQSVLANETSSTKRDILRKTKAIEPAYSKGAMQYDSGKEYKL